MPANRIARAISAWLCPEVHRDAMRYDRTRRKLDDARWWLGKQHPEAASMAQFLLDSESYDCTGEMPMRRPEWTWQAPIAVFGISEFRRWLDQAPFEGPAVPAPAPLPGGAA